MKFKALLLTTLSAAVVLSACESQQTKAAIDVVTLLNSAGNGTWTRVKDDSRIQGYAVFLNPQGKYEAIDTSKYVAGMTAAQLLAAAPTYTGLSESQTTYQQYGVVGSSTYNSQGCPIGGGDVSYSCASEVDAAGNDYYSVSETDYGWITYEENIYTDPSSGLVFDIGASANKDLEAVAATINSQSVASLRQQLVASYGLSEDRAQTLAAMGQSYQNISKTRALTAKDLADAQVSALGTDLGTLSKAKTAAANGDSKDYNALLQKAAQLNDISPEQAKSILNSFM